MHKSIIALIHCHTHRTRVHIPVVRRRPDPPLPPFWLNFLNPFDGGRQAGSDLREWLCSSRRSTADPTGPFLLRRSEEHTSELQSRVELVCRLLLEKQREEVL